MQGREREIEKWRASELLSFLLFEGDKSDKSDKRTKNISARFKNCDFQREMSLCSIKVYPALQSLMRVLSRFAKSREGPSS